MLSRKKRQVAVDTSFGHAYLSLCGGYHGNSERDQHISMATTTMTSNTRPDQRADPSQSGARASTDAEETEDRGGVVPMETKEIK